MIVGFVEKFQFMSKIIKKIRLNFKGGFHPLKLGEKKIRVKYFSMLYSLRKVSKETVRYYWVTLLVHSKPYHVNFIKILHAAG